MEIIKNFFTEAPTIIELFYLIAGISLTGSLLFHFLPEEKALQWFVTYRGYERRKEEFDWTATLKRQTIFLFSIFIYSVIILMLSSFFGEGVAKIGLWVFATLVLFASFWLEPIKKEVRFKD